MDILNKAQVDALFQREAVLLGSRDGVPKLRAAALFRKDAVDHVNKIGDVRFYGGYGIGDYTLFYLTSLGFQAAASFRNVKLLRELEEENQIRQR